MATTGFLLLCDYASRAIGGKLNIMGIYERIMVNELPFRIPHAYIVVRILIDPSEAGQKHEFKLDMVNDEDKEMMKLEGFFDVPPLPPGFDAEELRHDEIFPLYGPVFEEEGQYLLRMWLDGELDTTEPLYINMIKRSADQKKSSNKKEKEDKE